MNKTTTWVAGVAILATGGMMGYLMRGHAPTASVPFTTPSQAALSPADSRPVPEGAAPVGSLPPAPAWMRSPLGTAGGSAEPGDAARSADAQRMQRIRAAAEKLRIAGEQRKNPQDVVQALKELEDANGGPKFGGLDIAGMRKNMEIALAIRQKAEAMNELQQRAAKGDKTVTKEVMMAAVEDLKAMQAQMSANMGGSEMPSFPGMAAGR